MSTIPTVERDLAVMLGSGMTVEETAEELQLSVPRIYQILGQGDILKKLKEVRDKGVITDYQARGGWDAQPLRCNFSILEICTNHDISRDTLYRILRKHGIPLRTRPHHPSSLAEDGLIIQLYREDHTMETIAKRVDRSVPYLYSVLHRNDIPLRTK